MATLYIENEQSIHPLDIAEQLAEARDWIFDRPGDEELVAEIASNWCNYRIWFTWHAELGALIFSCAFDNKLPESCREKVYPLLSKVNEKLWVGHFDISPDDGCITFRHTQLMRGSKGATSEQIEDLLDIAIAECERFYPAFQTVIWSDKSVDNALELALFDTIGEA
jgi:hypothetical protein